MKDKNLLQIIKKSNLIKKGDKIILGISGGPDSVALFHLLRSIKDIRKIKLYLAHINHQLRGENAKKDEDFVRDLGKKFSIPVYVKSEDINEYSKINKIGLEEAGREVRYSFFEDIRKEVDANKVALAHNSDDNVETFLFRLMRGTSLSGLKSIPEKRDFYIRPLLNINKKHILNYLSNNNYKYQIDKSNKTTDYTRNKIRLDLIPKIEKDYNRKFKEKITRLIKEIDDIDNYLENKIQRYNNQKILEIKKIRKEPIFLQKKIINNFLERENKIEITNQKIENVMDLIKKGGTVSIDIGDGYQVQKSYDELKLVDSKKGSNLNKKEIVKIKKSTNLNEKIKFFNYIIHLETINSNNINNKQKNTFYFDYDKLKSDDIIIRTRRAGDKFKPLGMNGRTKKIKDLFINKKIKKQKRDEIPIIINRVNQKDNIIYILGIRGSEEYKIDKKTKKIMKISFEEGM
ncbi:MAG: tRNA lysidine(34) synthetase TilS [Fusobacteriota bacterium]